MTRPLLPKHFGCLFALMAWSTAAQGNGVADHQLERISYAENGARGASLVRWHLWSNGQGRYVLYDLDGSPLTQAQIDVGPDGFRLLAAELAPLEDRYAVACSHETSDQANGHLTWSRGIRDIVVHFDRGCSPAAGETAFVRLRRAKGIIEGWAVKKPVQKR